jgi:hypothetical protein
VEYVIPEAKFVELPEDEKKVSLHIHSDSLITINLCADLTSSGIRTNSKSSLGSLSSAQNSSFLVRPPAIQPIRL